MSDEQRCYRCGLDVGEDAVVSEQGLLFCDTCFADKDPRTGEPYESDEQERLRNWRDYMPWGRY